MNHTKKLETLNGLRKLCQGAVIFGFVTSAGGNVLHAVEASRGQFWGFITIAVILAALIPAIFGVMFEIVIRVIFRQEASWVMKLIAFLGAGAISGITAWNSYFHQRDAFTHFGDHTQAVLLPLAIDGLMIIGSVYLIELGFQIRDVEAWIVAGTTKKPVIKDETPTPKKERELTGKERIAAILARAPELSVKEIAAAAGTKEAYTYNIVGQLRKLVETDSALEGAVA